ncbi:MAG: hypothetical protein J6Y31_04955 [Bacteroidales bacterium]|nr:hypothetical protein [Bacteroidales bacterium]
MKKIIFPIVFLCSVTMLSAGSGRNNELARTHSGTFSYRFATKEEGRQLKLSNTSYLDSQTQNDIDWKLGCTGKSLDEFKAISAEQIMDFSEEEKKALAKTMDFIEARCGELGFSLPVRREIVFIKTTMDDEGHMGGYTLNNEIYLSEFDTERFARAYQGDPSLDADYREFRVLLARELVSHELFHTLTRNDAIFRQLMYSLVGFSIMDHNIQFGPTVQKMLMSNPDVEKYDNYGEFTINGQKRRCALISVYSSTFAEAVATNPEAEFYLGVHPVLVPIDDTDIMIPIEEATDFFDIMGRNTDYVLAAEECMAVNFSYLIAYGFNGRYDHFLEDNKLHFIPYETPQLIKAIHNTLLEHYAR